MIKLFIAACLLAMTYETNATAHEVTDRIASLARKEHQVSTQADDGKKVVWKLDASTRYNLGVIKKLLRESGSDDHLDKTAAALQDATNKLIKECRMEGPDHDALHMWLEVYLKHLKQLKDPSGNRQDAIEQLREDMKALDADFQ